MYFCSRQCKSIFERRVPRPAKDELIKLLTEQPNFTAIASMYGISDNAVRKWCDQYGLPRKTADWKTNPPSRPV
jgi:transposase-like protein